MSRLIAFRLYRSQAAVRSFDLRSTCCSGSALHWATSRHVTIWRMRNCSAPCSRARFALRSDDHFHGSDAVAASFRPALGASIDCHGSARRPSWRYCPRGVTAASPDRNRLRCNPRRAAANMGTCCGGAVLGGPRQRRTACCAQTRPRAGVGANGRMMEN